MKSPGPSTLTCLITRGESTAANYQFERSRILTTVREALEDGVNMIQIREKSLPARHLLDLTSAAAAIAASFADSTIIVNGRPDIALAAGADGVHLPENSIPVDAVKRAFGERLLIGASRHSMDGTKTAAAGGADYIVFGPIFETPGKGDAVGVEMLDRVCAEVGSARIIALGGIDETNVAEVMRTRVAGIAAIRSLHDRESRIAIVRQLMR